jgi:hypothetical protein
LAIWWEEINEHAKYFGGKVVEGNEEMKWKINIS